MYRNTEESKTGEYTANENKTKETKTYIVSQEITYDIYFENLVTYLYSNIMLRHYYVFSFLFIYSIFVIIICICLNYNRL